jgi:hypothetical protein
VIGDEICKNHCFATKRNGKVQKVERSVSQKTCHKVYYKEIFEKCSILLKFKEGDNFNRRNILSISRIALKLH